MSEHARQDWELCIFEMVQLEYNLKLFGHMRRRLIESYNTNNWYGGRRVKRDQEKVSELKRTDLKTWFIPVGVAGANHVS